MIVLYHTGTETRHDQLDTSLYTLPPGEPVEVENDFHATKLLEYFGGNFGLVRVNITRGKDGIKYDLVEAKGRADKALQAGEQAVINRYINTQLEDRMRKNYPALPPNARVQALIVKYKINLANYGIRPVGMPLGSPLAGPPPAASDSVSRDEFEALKEQNAVLTDQLNELLAASKAKGR